MDSSDDPLGPEGSVFIYRGDGTSLTVPFAAWDEPVIGAHPVDRHETNLFGFSLAWANTDGQDFLDLIIGAPGVHNTPQQQREGATLPTP
ncbi:MAG: hypothetical protein AB1486_30560 [Planctomycetota bacterium]